MAYQTNANILVALKRETTTGTAAGDTNGHQLRILDSPGLKMTRARIQSGEKRSDGTRAMSRLGGKQVGGSYNCELSVGGAIDLLLESILRSSFTAAVAITEAEMTSITTETNKIVASAGSWLDEGVRVGDIVRLTGHSTSANNDKNLRVLAVTALEITVPAGSLTANAVADSAFTLTILKKVKTPTSVTRHSYTVEQYDRDIDMSEIFLGVRLVGMQLAFQPNSMATAQFTFMGMDHDPLDEATSPYFTSPTVTTGLALVADDSALYKDGVQVTTFTGFTLNFQIAAQAPNVVGSAVPPDVFDNDLTVTGTVTGLRSNFNNLTAYAAETEFNLGILLEEPGDAPKNCIGAFFGRVKIGDLTAPVGGGDGPKIETLELDIGPKVAETGYDAGICAFFSSAA